MSKIKVEADEKEIGSKWKRKHKKNRGIVKERFLSFITPLSFCYRKGKKKNLNFCYNDSFLFHL